MWRTLGLGLGLAIAIIGVLFSAYVWSLALGLIVWAFLAGTLGDAALAHGRWALMLRRTPMPFVAVLLSVPLRWAPVLALLAALVLLLANGAWMAVVPISWGVPPWR